MNNIKNISIKRNTSSKVMNKLLKDNNINLTLVDDVYLGSSYKHNWKCKCGNVFVRVFNHIRIYNRIDCGCVEYNKQEQRYKEEVERDGDYEYIRSYRKDDILPSGLVVNDCTYIQVKHKYCGNIYEIKSGSFINSSSKCTKCCGSYENSLEYHYPEIAKMIVSDENGNDVNVRMISRGIREKFYFKCKNCNNISSTYKSLKHVVYYGYSCEYCSDGVSVPEKFMSNVLKQLNVEYIKEFSRLNIDWINIRIRYDFYISSLNMIIETHGSQHYEENNMFHIDLNDIEENDKIKKQLALLNGIDHYIVIDCRESTLLWLKENIIKSLSPYFDLSNIDWNLAWKESQNSLCVKAWELWDSGCSAKEIVKELQVTNTTVTSYLKKYDNYSKCESYLRINKENHYNFKSYIIREDLHGGNPVKYCGAKELYDCKFNAANVYECCNGQRNRHKDYIWYRDGDTNRRDSQIINNKNVFTSKEKKYRRSRVNELKIKGLGNLEISNIISMEMNMNVTPNIVKHDAARMNL